MIQPGSFRLSDPTGQPHELRLTLHFAELKAKSAIDNESSVSEELSSDAGTSYYAIAFIIEGTDAQVALSSPFYSPSSLPSASADSAIRLVGTSSTASFRDGVCTWEESFAVGVTGAAGKLLIYVIGDDLAAHKVRVVGSTHLILREMEANNLRRLAHVMETPDDTAAALHLNFGTVVERKDKYVRILHRSEDEAPTLAFTQEIRQKVQQELYEAGCAEPIKRAMLGSQLVREPALFRLEQVRDLLHDAQELLAPDDEAAAFFPFRHAQPRCGPVSATRMLCRTEEHEQEQWSRRAPMDGIALRMQSAAETYTLRFPNRYVLFNWVGAVRAAAAGADSTVRLLDVLRLEHAGGASSALCSISPDQPQEIFCIDEEAQTPLLSIDLRCLLCVEVSYDYLPARSATLEVSVCAASVFLPAPDAARSVFQSPLKALREVSSVTSFFVLRSGPACTRTAFLEGLSPRARPGADPLVLSVDAAALRDGVGGGALDVYLFTDGLEQLRPSFAGYQRVPLPRLLEGERSSRASVDLLLSSEAKYSKETTFPLNLACGIRVTVARCEGLAGLPRDATELQVVCALAAWKEGKTETHARTETRRLPARAEVAFEQDVLFSGEACELWGADVVVLELVGRGALGRSTLLGRAFLPAESVAFEETEHRLPLDLLIPSADAAVVVRSQRLQEKSGGLSTVTLGATATLCNPFTTTWPCEALSALHLSTTAGRVLGEGGLEAQVELLEAAPMYSGLVLFVGGLAGLTLERTKWRRSSVLSHIVVSDGDSLAKLKMETADLVVQAFENQRRTLLPPYQFSPDSLYRTDPHKFSDATGAFEAEFSTVPPPGHEWTGDWTVDQFHSKCDSDGWSYALTFGKLFENYKKGRAHDSPTLLGPSVRRRRWVRCARKLVEEGEKGVEKGGLSLVEELSDSPASAPATPTRAAVLSTFTTHRILKRCRELTEKGYILVPWSQVSEVRCVTPGVLSLTVTVGACTSFSKFEEADVRLYVSSCPAAALKQLVDERMQLCGVRAAVGDIVRSHRLGSRGDDSGGGAEDGRATVRVAMRELDAQLVALELRLARLDQAPVDPSASAADIERLDAARASLLALATRIRLYIAAMMVSGVHDHFDFSAAAAAELTQEDLAAALAEAGADLFETAARRILRLVQGLEARIKDACVCGWLYRGGALEKYLEQLVNAYLAEVEAVFAAALSSDVQGGSVASRRALLECFFAHQSYLERVAYNALTPLGFAAVPSPRLSLAVDEKALLQWYTSACKEFFREALELVFQRAKRSSESVHVPWRTARVWSARLVAKFSQTSLPEDCLAALEESLAGAHVTPLDRTDEFAHLTSQTNAALDILFVEGLVSVAQYYLGTVAGRDWLDEGAVMDAGVHDKVLGWLFACVNDISRVQVSDLLSRSVAQHTDADPLERVAVAKLEKVEEANAVFEKAFVVALDFLSCALFADLFRDFDQLWPDESPMPLILKALTDKSAVYSAALMDPYSFARLLLICADKIVALYLALIRDNGTTYSIEFDSEQVAKLANDVRLVQEAFAAMMMTSAKGDRYLCLIELRLRRLDDVCVLLGEGAAGDGEQLRQVLLRITDEGLCKHAEALAFANMIRACLRSRKAGLSAALRELSATSIRSLEAANDHPVVGLILAERSPESKVFDTEGSHSRLSMKILLEKSALSAQNQSKLMSEENGVGADAGPCWLFTSLFQKLFRSKSEDHSRPSSPQRRKNDGKLRI